MTVALSPLPVQKFFDNNGLPAVKAQLFTYAAGSSTKTATFVDAAGITQNTNPIILNARGECNLWLDTTKSYKFVLAPATDSDPPTNPIWSVDNIAGGAGSINQLQLVYPQTTAESAAGVTPTNLYYPGGHIDGFYDIRRYGASTAASSATNSTAIQAASDSAFQAGGGTVYIPCGTYNIDAVPHIWNTVSVVGDGKFSSILHKATATASTISDNTVRFWDSAAVGFPVCALHFVNHDGTSPWAYAECRDIGVTGDTTSPNTTTIVYGLFFRGLVGGKVHRCSAQYVQVGQFYGNGGHITSEICTNISANVQRGFYVHFMTSTSYHDNYAINFRFAGHFLSWYYSAVYSNACDSGGTTWKVGTTEIALAYQGNACRGGLFYGNGIETHNGSCFNFSNCISVKFLNNLALAITSNYTGGSDVVLWENNGNNACVYQDNRMQTSGMTGTGARHFMWKIASELGNYLWERNLFVATITDTTDTSTWANTIGNTSYFTFSPTIAGTTTAGVTTYTTQSGTVKKTDVVVDFRIRVTWSAQTGTGNILVGALPFTSANTDDVPVVVTSDSLTFPNQLTGMVNKNSTTISIYSQSTGGALAGVAMDTAATLWISGRYFV